MKLSWGINLLFYVAACLALFATFIQGKTWRNINVQGLQKFWKKIVGGLTMAGGLSLLAMLLHLQIASMWPYLLGGVGLAGLLMGLNLSAEIRGIILLTLSFFLFSQFSDATALSLPLLASFSGLVLGKLWHQDMWEDLILPSTWLLGLYWLVSSTPESSMLLRTSLLTIVVAIGLLIRASQTLPQLNKTPRFLQALALVITGGLAAFLAIQNLLLQPTLLSWAGLFAGSLALSFLLVNPAETNGLSAIGSQQESPSALQASTIALLLVGIATLIASRLFDTLGWIVLAVGLLSNRRAGSYVSVAALFLLSRVLLQTFLVQYNTNVTGINITHPYASAALYVGFAVMLLLPGWLNALHDNTESALQTAPPQPESLPAQFTEISNPVEINTTHHPVSFQPVTLVLLSLGPILIAGLSNYFLHVEATASLLLALVVAGLGVGFLGHFKASQTRGLLLVLGLLSIVGALASPELLGWGNEAEKSQKLIVLSAAMFSLLVAAFMVQRTMSSGRKSIHVA